MLLWSAICFSVLYFFLHHYYFLAVCVIHLASVNYECTQIRREFSSILVTFWTAHTLGRMASRSSNTVECALRLRAGQMPSIIQKPGNRWCWDLDRSTRAGLSGPWPGEETERERENIILCLFHDEHKINNMKFVNVNFFGSDTATHCGYNVHACCIYMYLI